MHCNQISDIRYQLVNHFVLTLIRRSSWWSSTTHVAESTKTGVVSVNLLRSAAHDGFSLLLWDVFMLVRLLIFMMNVNVRLLFVQNWFHWIQIEMRKICCWGCERMNELCKVAVGWLHADEQQQGDSYIFTVPPMTHTGMTSPSSFTRRFLVVRKSAEVNKSFSWCVYCVRAYDKKYCVQWSKIWSTC